MTRRTQAEVSAALAEVAKLKKQGLSTVDACAQVGINPNAWYGRAARKHVEKPRRKYAKRKPARPTLHEVPVPETLSPHGRLIALMGAPDDVLAAIRSLG